MGLKEEGAITVNEKYSLATIFGRQRYYFQGIIFFTKCLALDPA